MNAKKRFNPLSFFHLLSAVLIAFLMVSCGGSDGNRISKVLHRCADVSKKASAYHDNPGAQADFLANELQKMDVSDCPADFRMAFQAHIMAWRQAGPAIQNNHLGTAFAEGLVAGITENPNHIGQANQQAAYAVQRINETYHYLTQLAAKYGARIPTSVVGQ